MTEHIAGIERMLLTFLFFLQLESPDSLVCSLLSIIKLIAHVI